eukprot:scaffold83229_cov29-Cyclotella_meneghiniana.AAC.1
MFWLIQDAHNFLHQFLPSPIALFRPYRFSAADLTRFPSTYINSALPVSSTEFNTIFHTFDVLSYNINNVASSTPSRIRLILRAIFSSGANIILLQETNEAWEKLLLDDAIALQYTHRYFHHPTEKDRAAGGIAILSRYRLKDISVLDFTRDISGSVFPALVCKVMIPLSLFDQEQKLYSEFPELLKESIISIGISNIHLRPPVNLDGTAWFDTARKTEPIRLAEVKRLIRRTAANSSLNGSTTLLPELDIIAGDYNEDNFGAALIYLDTLGYIDALQQYVPIRKETHQWPFMGGMWTLRKRLDHVLWRKEKHPLTSNESTKKRMYRLQCLGCGVVTGYETGASDHQPVLSRFGIVIN